MSVTINGTTGITVLGITNTGNTTLGDGSADSTRINETMVVGTDTDNVKMSTSAAITTVVLGDSSGVSGAAARLSYNRGNGAVKLTTGTNDAPIERLSMDNYGSFTIPGNVTMNSQNSGPLAGFRNRIINGGFDVWQRGTSMSGTNPNFGPDRFMVLSDTSQTLSRVDYISSASGLYAARFTKNNTATYINFGTVIENGYNNAVVGNVVTFSCLMRASVSATLTMQILKGTGFDMVTQLLAVNKSVTTTWTKFSITLDGTALSYDGTNKHLRVSVANLSSLAISGWVEFKDFQLEVGSVPTPFEYRPIGTELALCQRYAYDPFYEVTIANRTAGKAFIDYAGATTYWATIQFPVNMRTAPSLVAPTAANFSLGFPDSLAIVSIGINHSTPELAILQGTCATGTVNTNHHLYRPGTTEKLLFIAEL